MRRPNVVHERFTEWLGSRTPEEYRLQREALEFEDLHFSDLSFTSPRIIKNLLQYEVQGEDGVWFKTSDYADVGIHSWIFRYRRFRKPFIGLCDCPNHTIYIGTRLVEPERTATLLHEMIHAYEFQISASFREWLLLDLYKRVSKRIPQARLDRYIKTSTHVMINEAQHGILFLLKSLELDLKFKWQPGTVFGYGRTEFLNGRRKADPCVDE